MQVTMIQHAVGQGGMMSGLLETGKGSFHWVYDCGSNQLDSLEREIQIVALMPVDVLFLSHLDNDHVNGIDKLLLATEVKEVVLPYLHDIDRLIAAVHADSNGKLSGDFTNFLSDIPEWLYARGVQKITFIEPAEDGDEDVPPPTIPERIDPSEDGKVSTKWAGKTISSENSPAKEAFDVTRLDASAALSILTNSRPCNWILCPYAHRPSDLQLKLFGDELKNLFKSKLSVAEILKEYLRNSSLRKGIRDAYDLIWSDHNLVSMGLYAGPVQSGDNYRFERLVGPFSSTGFLNGFVGWLGTGDMHLNVRVRRESLIKHFETKGLLELVEVFGLPHHGSKRNYNHSLLKSMPNLKVCTASAGRNSYGHPSYVVKDNVEASRIKFVHVNSSWRTTFKTTVYLD